MQTIPSRKRPSLEDVLAYQNPQIIISFCKTFAISKEEALAIFDELKRMLWLINEMEFDGSKAQGNRFYIDQSLLIIDEMWHKFILFTSVYGQFCEQMFGAMIHHYPSVQTDEEYATRFVGMSRDEVTNTIMNDKRWQYTYVLQKLGKASFQKWYTEFHEKYSAPAILALRAEKITAQERIINE